MAREFALAGVDPEDLKPTPPPEPPKGFRARWDHFWQYYRWPVLIAVAVAAALFVCIAQLMTRETPDYTLILVTKQAWTDVQRERLATLMEAGGEDIDGDGKVSVRVQNVFMGSDGGNTLNASEQLTTYLYAGNYYLYAFDPDLYDQFILQNLAEDTVFSEPLAMTATGVSEDGRYWNWNGSAVQQEDTFRLLSDDLYFMVRTDATGSVRQPHCAAALRAFIAAAAA